MNNNAQFVFGSENETTNNRMELLAAIMCIEGHKKGEDEPPETIPFTKPRVTQVIYTDSKYLVDGITKWIYGWKKSGWKNSKKEPVKNVDLWQRLDECKSCVEFRWMKGHDIKNTTNTAEKNLLIEIQSEVDRLARRAAEEQRG